MYRERKPYIGSADHVQVAQLVYRERKLYIGSAVNIGSAEQSAATNPSGKPIRGMKSDQVRANFGMPQTIRNPVGNPPIIRWEYSNFVVFFEYDTVIHAVNKR